MTHQGAWNGQLGPVMCTMLENAVRRCPCKYMYPSKELNGSKEQIIIVLLEEIRAEILLVISNRLCES